MTFSQRACENMMKNSKFSQKSHDDSFKGGLIESHYFSFGFTFCFQCVKKGREGRERSLAHLSICSLKFRQPQPHGINQIIINLTWFYALYNPLSTWIKIVVIKLMQSDFYTNEPYLSYLMNPVNLPFSNPFYLAPCCIYHPPPLARGLLILLSNFHV